MKPKSEPLLTLQDLADDWQVSTQVDPPPRSPWRAQGVRIGHQIRIRPEDKAAYEKLNRE